MKRDRSSMAPLLALNTFRVTTARTRSFWFRWENIVKKMKVAFCFLIAAVSSLSKSFMQETASTLYEYYESSNALFILYIWLVFTPHSYSRADNIMVGRHRAQWQGSPQPSKGHGQIWRFHEYSLQMLHIHWIWPVVFPPAGYEATTTFDNTPLVYNFYDVLAQASCAAKVTEAKRVWAMRRSCTGRGTCHQICNRHGYSFYLTFVFENSHFGPT